MINKCINKQIFDNTFAEYSKKVGVILSSTKTPGPYFDPKRNTGYVKTKKNPIPVKALIDTLTPESLICRSLGLKEIGAVKLTVQDCDVNLIKIAEKIIIDGKYYTTFNQALGNRFQVFPLKFNFSNIILFRDTKNG